VYAGANAVIETAAPEVPDPSDPLEPTGLMLTWLADNPESLTEARSKGALEGRIAAFTSDASMGGAAVTEDEFEELRTYLEKRVSSDNDLASLRRDLAKYASMHAPRDVAEMPAMVAWALGRIDWQSVADFIAAEDPAPE
jgi:hypothetical protein